MTRRHDDAHYPLAGRGKRANRKHYTPPSAVLVPDRAEAQAALDEVRANLETVTFPKALEDKP